MDAAHIDRHALLGIRIAAEMGYLTRYARSRMRDEQLAQEAVQETLLAALESRDSFGGRAKLRTWLTGILLHKMHDAFRRAAREGCVPEGEPHESVDAITPDDCVHARQVGALFLAALESLPPKQARAFTMREIEGKTSRSICRELGVSTGNFWVLMHRARAALRAATQGATA